MGLPNWLDVFEAVCSRGGDALYWGLPEPWVHAELYAELLKTSPSTAWLPLSTEVPYVTFSPVQLPKTSNRDWREVGAVKWVDMRLHSADHNAWCWFEFKARPAGAGERRTKASLEARHAFKKDIAALVAFDAELTSRAWSDPDEYARAYWFADILTPHADKIVTGKHYCVAAFLQIGGELEEDVLSQPAVAEQARRWLASRVSRTRFDIGWPSDYRMTSHLLEQQDCSLLVCQWPASER
jgi:hypothetical protein